MVLEFLYSILYEYFQNGCPDEFAEKTKIDISVSPHLIITEIHNLSLAI